MPWRRPSVAIEPRLLYAYGFTRPRRLRDSRRAWRSACWQVGGSKLVGGRVRHGGDVAERVHAVQALDPEVLVDRHPAALVERQPEPRGDGIGSDAGRPDDGLGLDPAAVGQHGAAAVDRRERGARRGSPRRAARASARRTRARLSGTCPRMRGPESTKTQRGRTPARRGCRRSAPSVSSWSSATASTPAKPAPAKTNVRRRCGARRLGVGELDLAQHVVAQPDRVADVLEAERVLAQARDVRRARDRAERDHEPLVADRERAGLRGRRGRPCARGRARRPSRAGGRRAGTSCAAARSRGAARCCPAAASGSSGV